MSETACYMDGYSKSFNEEQEHAITFVLSDSTSREFSMSDIN